MYPLNYSNPIKLRTMKTHYKNEHQFHPIFSALSNAHIAVNLAL
ncbi:hypothetical protein VCR3J2_350349 [Vibrio coralliirubri]|nr:hypothetical protein VCR3J2_350349 [Vibrio coralliirubri]